MRENTNQKIYAVCNEIRQYAFGSRELLSAHLPTLHDKTLQHIIDSLYDLLQEDFILGTPVAGQINNIKRPYRDYYNNRPGFHRKSSSREFKGKTALSISSKVMPDENQSTNVLEIKDIRLVEKKIQQKLGGGGRKFEDCSLHCINHGSIFHNSSQLSQHVTG